MNKCELKQFILQLNMEGDKNVTIPSDVIEIILDNFQIWKDFDGMSYKEICRVSDETGEFPSVDQSINFYGDMDTPKKSLGTVLDELIDIADGFDMTLEDAAKQHCIVFVEIDDMFVLLY